MSEHWSLPIIRANLSFSFRLHLLCYTSSCMPSEIITSESTSNVILFIQDIYIYCSNFGTVTISTQRLTAVATSVSPLSDLRDNQFSRIHLRVLTALLGLSSFLNLGPKLDESTLNCREHWILAFPCRRAGCPPRAAQNVPPLGAECPPRHLALGHNVPPDILP